jgi:hypothetical protein
VWDKVGKIVDGYSGIFLVERGVLGMEKERWRMKDS